MRRSQLSSSQQVDTRFPKEWKYKISTMVNTKMFGVLLLLLAIFYEQTGATEVATNEYCGICEDQLTKYRKFILQAIINFEDVCDSYHPDSAHDFLHSYQPQERGEIWAFFKLLMAQFNDVEFLNVIHDAILERCRTKSLRDEKRNSVVLGKKQRFHSWGGKRASQQPLDLVNRIGEEKLPEKPYFI